MLNQAQLHQFSHLVPYRGGNGNGIVSTQKHLPLAQLTLDFENGSLLLKGDMEYLMALNSSPFHLQDAGKRLIIEADIHPNKILDLATLDNQGAILSLTGIINDGSLITNCSGVLILQKRDQIMGSQLHGIWLMSLVLYEGMDATQEIRFDFPICTIQECINYN